MGLHAVLHDGQEGLDEAGDAGPAADVLHRAVHVVGAATQGHGAGQDGAGGAVPQLNRLSVINMFCLYDVFVLLYVGSVVFRDQWKKNFAGF